MFSSRDEGTIKKRVCIATASPAKFPEAVQAAGIPFTAPPSIQALFTKPTRCWDMNKGEDWYGILTRRIEDIASRRGK